MYLIYTTLFCILLPFLPLRLWWRGRKNIAYRSRWQERFAIYSKKTPTLPRCLWVHAVSLGEVTAVTPLIKALCKIYPQFPVVFTTMTPTGATQMQKTFSNDQQIIQLYVPYDYPWMVKKFIKHFNPQCLIIMETELWPNILRYTHKNHIPIFLANARLTQRSFASYYKLRFFFQKLLDKISYIMTQSQKDQNYYLQLGADPQRVRVMGNIKFDITVPSHTVATGKQLRQLWQSNDRPTWIAASTHANEEELVLAAFQTILRKLPQALLILVPRHPERFNSVALLCQEKGFNLARHSLAEPVAPNTNIILGDVMGQLLAFYAAADVAFVGGSLVPIGGHNILEPAALAVPIVIGPHTETLADIRRLLEENQGLIGVDNEMELAQKVLQLLQDPELRQKYSVAAQRMLEQNKGAINKIIECIQTEVKFKN